MILFFDKEGKEHKIIIIEEGSLGQSYFEMVGFNTEGNRIHILILIYYF